jgi:hypothetical protein
VLPKRFGAYGLTLHPEKTRMVAFGRPRQKRKGMMATTMGRSSPVTFDFLGFTIHWGEEAPKATGW